jgi:hypothetical protein
VAPLAMPVPPAATPVPIAAVDAVGWLKGIAAGRDVASIGDVWPAAMDESFVTLALLSGARSVTAIDATAPDHPARTALRERLAHLQGGRKRLSDVTASPGADDFAGQVGSFDVVVCRDMLARLPDPLGALMRLRRITRTACHVSVPVLPGTLAVGGVPMEIAPLGAIYLPGASAELLRGVADALGAAGADVKAMLPRSNMPWITEGHADRGHLWWGMTPGFLERIARLAGFRLLASAPEPDGVRHGVVLGVG